VPRMVLQSCAMGARSTKWGVLLTCTLIVCGMGYASWNHKSGDAVRERVERTVAAILAHEPAPVYRRTALWGETAEGDAFEQYALAAAAKGKKLWLAWNEASGEFRERAAAITKERQQQLREIWAPVIEQVRSGAHGGTVTMPSGPVGNLKDLDEALFLELRSLAGEARMADFGSLWMDAFTFAVDRLPGPAGGWREQFARSYLSLIDDEVLTTLREQDLQLLGECLANADPLVAQLPDSDAYLARWVQTNSREARIAGLGIRTRLYAWQHGFDPFRADLEGFDELFALRAILRPVASDGGQREAQWSAYRAAPRERHTPMTSHIDEMSELSERQPRQVLAQLRLLRLAVAFHRGVELPQLADPFASAPLQVRIEDDAAVLHSASTFEGSQRIARRR
jgi:hypothetical protein